MSFTYGRVIYLDINLSSVHELPSHKTPAILRKKPKHKAKAAW